MTPESGRFAYFRCAAQRSGSNLLCELLARSGVAGRPTEHFVPWFPYADALGHPHAGFERSAWARARGIRTFPEFLDAVVREGSTPNEIFGTKLMWNALEGFLEKRGEVEGCRDVAPGSRLGVAFASPRFLHLRRRNRVRQAVSWALAAQTGHYDSHRAASAPPLASPSFDLQLLDGLHRLVVEADDGWDAFFARAGVQPPRVWYEDLVADLAASLRGVVGWLGAPRPRTRTSAPCATSRRPRRSTRSGRRGSAQRAPARERAPVEPIAIIAAVCDPARGGWGRSGALRPRFAVALLRLGRGGFAQSGRQWYSTSGSLSGGGLTPKRIATNPSFS